MVKHYLISRIKAFVFPVMIAVVTVMGSLALSSSALAANDKPAATSSEKWRGEMRALLGTALQLFPLALDEQKFSDPKNSKKINALLKDLNSSSAVLQKHTHESTISADPILPYSAEVFRDELEIARSSFASGKVNQAQGFLRRSLSQCLGCHTHTNSGTQFVQGTFRDEIGKLDARSRFLAYTSVRQFDSALAELDNLLKLPPNPESPATTLLENERIARIALAIAVRVKQEPRDVLKVIEKISKWQSLPPSIKISVDRWRNSVLDWQKAAKIDHSSDEKMIEASRQILTQAKFKRDQEDGMGEVDLLRASALLHELLRRFPKTSYRSEAYFELGTIYEWLPSFTFWDLSDRYFEACIRGTPHSEQALKCYDKYEESINIGYTGSGGTNIPSAIRKNLQAMRELATPKKESSTKQ